MGTYCFCIIGGHFHVTNSWLPKPELLPAITERA